MMKKNKMFFVKVILFLTLSCIFVCAILYYLLTIPKNNALKSEGLINKNLIIKQIGEIKRSETGFPASSKIYIHYDSTATEAEITSLLLNPIDDNWTVVSKEVWKNESYTLNSVILKFKDTVNEIEVVYHHYKSGDIGITDISIIIPVWSF